MHVSKSFLLVMIIFSLVWLLVGPTPGSAKIYHLTILHTNNQHGHFAKFSLPGNPDIGGMAAQSTLINIVRAEVEQAGGHVLLLSAGNVNIGVPESDLLDAEPDFRLMNILGYDAMTPSLQEFNNPRDVLLQQREWAGCSFLSANIVKKETGQLLFDPYIIKNFDGLHVAIFGLTWEIAPLVTLYGKDLESRNAIEIAKPLVPKLKAEADLVIALSNIGFSALQEERSPGDVEVAKAIPGIDVIIGRAYAGLTTLEKPEVTGDTLIVQSEAYGLSVGRLDLTIDSDTDTITEYTSTVIPVNLKQEVIYRGKSYYRTIDTGYVEDPAVLDVVQRYLAQTEEVLSQPVGEALVRLDGDKKFICYRETNLMNLLTDAMRAKTGAEIAIMNAGGIGVTAAIEPGAITFRDILEICPYGNTLVLLDMTGAQVMDVLTRAAMRKIGDDGFLHVSGLIWTRKHGDPENVMVGSTPIELERIYKVVTTSFLAGGGDGHRFNELPQFNTGFLDADATRDYIMKAGTVAPKVEGRLTIIE